MIAGNAFPPGTAPGWRLLPPIGPPSGRRGPRAPAYGPGVGRGAPPPRLTPAFPGCPRPLPFALCAPGDAGVPSDPPVSGRSVPLTVIAPWQSARHVELDLSTGLSRYQ